jgi:hypothetical protein
VQEVSCLEEGAGGRGRGRSESIIYTEILKSEYPGFFNIYIYVYIYIYMYMYIYI